jgi:cell wall-associated NlpC family hydrolase
MKKQKLPRISFIFTAVILMVGIKLSVSAESLPSAGIDYTLGGNTTSLREIQETQINHQSPDYASTTSPHIPAPSVAAIPTVDPNDDSSGQVIAEETVTAVMERTMREMERQLAARREEELFRNLVIAQVRNYVNVRSTPSEQGEIVGKLYNNSAGNLLEEEDGWYKIRSGSVVGYVKGEYCVTGDEAIALAREVGTRIATVDTTTLKVRNGPGTEYTVLTLVPIEDDLLVVEELGDWVKVDVEEGEGYVHSDYVILSTEFVKAESREEEAARLAKEAAERRAAQAAAARRNNNNTTRNNNQTQTVFASGEGSELGRAVANYGLQFVGNPYRYGGSSLTNGADCSGFVMSVYAAFGVALPHSSSADRRVGMAVDGLANAVPGDIVCYSGHVGIYIGNGQIVHASTRRTGIIVSNANYRRVLAVRRIF